MTFEQLPFPTYQPTTFRMLEREPEFDADRHLKLEIPSSVITLAELGYDRRTREQCPSELALTAPFSMLSDAGVEALRQIAVALMELEPRTENDPDAAYIKSRACSYSSRFVQSLWHCPRLTEFFSDIAGTAIAAHSLPSAGVAFIYAPEDPRKTNQGWHLDSVGPFACIIALNDPGSLEGGRFQYFHDTRDEIADLVGTPVEDLRASVGKLSELPCEKVVTVDYQRAGHGIFMQGGLVLHRGEPLRARGERIIFGAGFRVLNLDYPDEISFNWREISKWNSPTMRCEYARHKAWRAKQMLEQMVAGVSIDEDPGREPFKCLQKRQLQYASAIP